jgi:hypothetical protein
VTTASLLDLVYKLPPKSDGLFAFRGVGRTDWNNDPAIFREPSSLLEHERDMVRELPSIHPAEFSADSSMFDRLVRMQHYGLPTRLFDVTVNPLIALYFASVEDDHDGYIAYYNIPPDRQKYYDSDAVSCISNLANLSNAEKDDILSHISLSKTAFNGLKSVNRLLQFIKSEKPYFRPQIEPADLARPFYVRPRMSNRRIIAQSGSFILYGLRTQSETPYQRNISVKYWRVPASAKTIINKELRQLGINVSTLFPEIDKAAAYVVDRFSGAP